MWNTRLGVFTKLDNTENHMGERKRKKITREGVRAGPSFLKLPTDVLRISVSGITRGEDLNVCWTVWLNLKDINPNENRRTWLRTLRSGKYICGLFFMTENPVQFRGIIKTNKKRFAVNYKVVTPVDFYVSTKSVLSAKAWPFPRWAGRSHQPACCRLLFCGFSLTHKQESHITRGGHKHQPSN